MFVAAFRTVAKAAEGQDHGRGAATSQSRSASHQWRVPTGARTLSITHGRIRPTKKPAAALAGRPLETLVGWLGGALLPPAREPRHTKTREGDQTCTGNRAGDGD